MLDPPSALADALALKDGAYGVAADPILSARLGLKIGDRFAIGAQTFVLRADLKSEPDKLAGGVGFGPRVLMSQDGFARLGFSFRARSSIGFIDSLFRAAALPMKSSRRFPRLSRRHSPTPASKSAREKMFRRNFRAALNASANF